WPGRLAILPRPRAGEWLEDELRAWKDAGINVVGSTLTEEEIADLDLDREAELCLANGMEHNAFPIPDRGVPTSLKTTIDLVHRLESKLAEGKTVGIHCRAGIGRSAL